MICTEMAVKESRKIKSMTIDERKDYKIDAIKFSRSDAIPETINIDGVDRPTQTIAKAS